MSTSLALTDNALATVPDADMEEFNRLPTLARDGVSNWLREIGRMQPGPLVQAFAAMGKRLGVSMQTARRVYYAYKNAGGDWRKLIDKRLCPELWAGAPVGLPAAFIEYWKGIQQTFQRRTGLAAAHRKLIRNWHKGDAIPGYPPGRIAPDPMTGYPAGWTYENLSRPQYTLEDYEKKVVRIGRNAATELLPKVLTTRVGLAVGEVVMFDDQDYDQNINFLGVNRKITRPSGFNALDVLSGCDVLRGYKPTILHDDGTKEKLRQVDFEWFMVNYLTTVGYRDDAAGTLFIWEKGTTKTGKDFFGRMLRATGGKVRVESGGLHNAAAFAGLFEGQPRGNPRFKAARESLFNLVRNEMCALPGATGRNRDEAPEGNYGLEIYNRRLIDAMATLPRETIELFTLPVMNWHGFVEVADWIWEHCINRRTHHRLEGWERLKFLTHEWRPSLDTEHWSPAAALDRMPADQRLATIALVQNTPGLWRTGKLSPRHVFDAGRGELRKVAGHAVPELLGPEAARRATVTKDRHFVIEDAEIEPEGMWFLAKLHDGRTLTAGASFQVYLNPFCTDRLEVCDGRGRWLGTAPRWEPACKTDTAALHRAFNEVRKIEAELLAPVARRGAAITRKAIQDKRTNIALLEAAAAANGNGTGRRKKIFSASSPAPARVSPRDGSHPDSTHAAAVQGGGENFSDGALAAAFAELADDENAAEEDSEILEGEITDIAISPAPTSFSADAVNPTNTPNPEADEAEEDFSLGSVL